MDPLESLQEELLTTGQAAEAWNCSIVHTYTIIARAQLPTLRTRLGTFLRREDVARIARERDAAPRNKRGYLCKPRA